MLCMRDIKPSWRGNHTDGRTDRKYPNPTVPCHLSAYWGCCPASSQDYIQFKVDMVTAYYLMPFGNQLRQAFILNDYKKK